MRRAGPEPGGAPARAGGGASPGGAPDAGLGTAPAADGTALVGAGRGDPPAAGGAARAGRPRLVLIGPSGAGKSTAGALLAAGLGVALHETDDEAAASLGSTMAALVVRRDPRLAGARRERAVAALAEPEGVTVLGPSMPADPGVVAALARAREEGATVVWLEAGVSTVSRRMGLGAPRSVGLGAPRAALRAMMEEARAHYAAVADSSVETDSLTPAQVADSVLQACKLADG